MRALNARPLSFFPKIWRFLPQEIVPIERTAPAAKAPDGMVRIPANPAFRFDVHGIEIEGADDIGVDVQYPGDDSPRRHHAQTLSIPEFYIDEFQDEHTRAATLRGGSYYRPSGSRWYFPSAYKLNEHGKYLLIAPSKDRAGTLGFRCVKDAQ